jgi:Txe/YoeB family toxin of toxin-antitoxin system
MGDQPLVQVAGEQRDAVRAAVVAEDMAGHLPQQGQERAIGLGCAHNAWIGRGLALASTSPALKQKAQALLDLLAADPYQQPPPYEALTGDLRGACSRRINIQHRLVYQVVEDVRMVKVLQMRSQQGLAL